MADQNKADSIRDCADFREDLERLSSCDRKSAKIIRKSIYDTIDARVSNFVERALAAAPAVPAVDALTVEAVADAVTKLMRAGHIDWTSSGPEHEGGDDGGFNDAEEERATLCHFIRKVLPGLATPSTAPDEQKQQRPTDDELWDQTIRDRDTYHEWADKLAEAISKHFDAYIGEHSNTNCPWAEALEAIEAAAHPANAGAVAVEQAKPKLIETLKFALQDALGFAELIEAMSKPDVEIYKHELRGDSERAQQRLNVALQAIEDAAASQPQATPLEATSEPDEPTARESLIACLGDDAAKLEAENPGDEMAQTMREAAAMLEAGEQMGGAQVASDDIEQRTEQIRLAHANPAARSRTHLIRDVAHLLAHIALLRTAPATGSTAAPADRFDEALATFLAEHIRLNQDGIDSHSMKIVLALNYAALNPVPESDIDEWREQGYIGAAEGEATSERKPLTEVAAEFRKGLCKLNRATDCEHLLHQFDALVQHHGIGGGKND